MIQFLAIIVILLLITFIIVNVSSRLISIDNSKQTSQRFSIAASYFIDTSNQLNARDIYSKKELLTAIDINKIPFELADQTYWIKVQVTNKTNTPLPLVLYADNSMLDVFDIYQPNNTFGLDQSLIHTDLIASNNNNRLLKVYPHLTFQLMTNQTKTFLLKLQTLGPPNIPLMVLSDDDFSQRMLYAQIFYGAFIGLVILMAMYNLVLFFAIKDKVYLVYIGYLLSAFFVLSSLTGFGYFIFSPKTQEFFNQYLLFIDYYLVIFLLVFTLFFLRYDQQNNKTYQVGLVLTAFLAICSFYSLTLDTIAQTKLFFSIQPVFYLFALFVLLRRLHQDFSWAKYYLLSWVPLLIGAAIQPLVLLNYLEYSFVTRNAFLFAILIELTLMAFALAERMKRNEKDRLNDITYHISSGLPRKSNLESYINRLIQQKYQDFKVLVIKPEHIEKVALYVDDSILTELYQRLFYKLSSLFQYNDKVFALTDKGEKLCLINNNSLMAIIDKRQKQQSIEELIDAIQQTVSDNYYIKSIKLPLSAVVGISIFSSNTKKSHQLINQALLAANRAETIHQKWSYYEDNSSNENAYLLQLTSDLQFALENNQLEVFHQPQIDLRTLRVCSSECLIRWQHPDKGFIPPTVFIPIAEDMGLINQLTLWVIKTALQQQFSLSNDYGFNHMISINISGKDIASQHFFPQVMDIIEASTIPADKLIFELTESASFTYNEQSLSLIEKLVELGITISIDDFGTGYSSMSQVSNLPFQELKVDRQFVENVNDDHKRKIIAEATVKMAKGLGLEVVAEGINSQADEDTLRDFGCDIGQGYFYAKPMAIDDYISWLENLDNGRIKQPVQGEFIPAEK
ncbi:EAL domain-containing protein [Colwellia sp. 1_MG-2023]|uniref:EAL domain-containing protein n=1 Tax=Colwellia sp. 1_MG-2023 TaxID=3062649 RepID=UPI0026E19F5A|nr:EAL domain-containing protein [Colwellia sp. 1_MG-2023]MDO6446098.1 EAL domain-containing protein [Colwellia sp. 1_MG-2023]